MLHRVEDSYKPFLETQIWPLLLFMLPCRSSLEASRRTIIILRSLDDDLLAAPLQPFLQPKRFSGVVCIQYVKKKYQQFKLSQQTHPAP